MHAHSLMADKLFKALRRAMLRHNAKTQLLTMTVSWAAGPLGGGMQGGWMMDDMLLHAVAGWELSVRRWEPERHFDR